MLALAGLPEEKVRAIAGKASVGRSFAHLLKAPDTAPVDAVRPAALFNYAMLLYYDSEWMLAEFNTMRQRGVPPQEMHRRACALQPNLTLRGRYGVYLTVVIVSAGILRCRISIVRRHWMR